MGFLGEKEEVLGHVKPRMLYSFSLERTPSPLRRSGDGDGDHVQVPPAEPFTYVVSAPVCLSLLCPSVQLRAHSRRVFVE